MSRLEYLAHCSVGTWLKWAPAPTAPLHYERHRPEQTTLYRLVQQHAASFIAHIEASTGSELPRFIKDEFDAFLECGILAHGFLRLRCGECGHDKLLAFSCKRRGFCPSCSARRVSQTAAHPIDHVMPHVPVRQWVLSLPIPLRVSMAAQPELVTPVLQVVQRVITRHLRDDAQIPADEGHGGAVTLIQRFGSAANLNIHLHCLVLDGAYRCGADGAPTFVEAGTPTDDELHELLQTVIVRLMKMLMRRGTHLVMSPLEFMQRLAAQVPRPRLHLIRFHGVLAPNAKLRPLVVPQAPRSREEPAAEVAAEECETEAAQARPGRISWAMLLKRVFDIDMYTCPNCGAGELKIIAVILERPVIEEILSHLGLDPQPPPRGRAREAGQVFAT